MKFLSKAFILLIITTFATSAWADGTGSAILLGLFYICLVAIFLTIPVILIIKTDNGIKKTPWVLIAIIIGVHQFYVPWLSRDIWIYRYIFQLENTNYFIPLLLLILPSYLFLLAFWIADAKKSV